MNDTIAMKDLGTPVVSMSDAEVLNSLKRRATWLAGRCRENQETQGRLWVQGERELVAVRRAIAAIEREMQAGVMR